MPDANTDIIVSVAAQIPIVIAFIWFVLRIMRMFLEYLKLHDSDWKLFFDQMTARWSSEQTGRDQQWRNFLESAEKRSVDAYGIIAEQMKALASRIDSFMAMEIRHTKQRGED